jgi:hypothetical protein
VNGYADAAIVGSALVGALITADDAGRPDDLTELRAVVADLAAGVRDPARAGRSGNATDPEIVDGSDIAGGGGTSEPAVRLSQR